jgi:hypothetical protein
MGDLELPFAAPSAPLPDIVKGRKLPGTVTATLIAPGNDFETVAGRRVRRGL